MTRITLLDNTVLSNFGGVRRTDLVTAAWPATAYTTGQVLAEYEAGVIARSLPTGAWADVPIVSLNAEEEALAAQLPSGLKAGERSCLAAAMRRGGALATDDAGARRFARRHNIMVTGSIGILGLAIGRGDISLDEANDLLARMIAAGYRSPFTRVPQIEDE